MFTCLSCQVAFIDPELQKEHFHTDWHRYNLKRKVANLPPVTVEEYNSRVSIAQKTKAESEPKSIYCAPCKKVFSNKKSFENHIKSKKHLEKENINVESPAKSKVIHKATSKVEEDEIEEDSEVEEVDSDEWEGDPLPVTHCLFCYQQFPSFEKNLKHMTSIHSFFIPDIQFCTDIQGLITYLGEKVGCGMECLWCNEKSKKFWTVEATQRHMRDKGHCMVKFEGNTLLEYSDFYDYSSSYPNADDPDFDPDEEVEPQKLLSDGFELTLPSGATVGHRSLLRYYKQRINPNSRLAVQKSSSSLRSKIMDHYKALGWKGASSSDIKMKVRDIQFMNKVKSRHWVNVGVKANKLQHHFRPQVMF